MRLLQLSRSDSFRAGFVGVDGRGKPHLGAVSTIEDSEIVALADADGDLARTFAGHHDPAACESAAEMRNAQGLDTEWIATPPAFHRDPFIGARSRENRRLI